MLSKFSVKKPFTIIVAVILVLILGTVSFMNLKTDLLPSIDLPYVVVMTSYPGASPEEVEMVVTKPIEQLLATTSNIENVSSISRENSSTVILEFNNDVNMDSAIIEINGGLDLIKPNWNDDIGTPMIMKLNPDMLPIMVASIDVEDMDAAGITKLVSENIIPEFESIGGVASVEGVGLIEESIEVIISPEKIEKLNQKILASIDSELSKAENKLLEAKREIDTGKAKLDSENKKQSSKLAEGEKAIAMGKEQISSVESTIKSGEEELLKKKEELQTSMNVLNREEEQLLNARKQLESLGGNISEEQRKELEKVKLGLKTIAQNKIEINAGLDTITNKISELEKQKSGIEAQKTELNKQEEQIKEGKAVLKTEMNKAKAQLQSGEATLNQKMSELESAKEEAFKNASLDGVVTEEMISGILSAQNFSMPAGYVSENNTDYLVKVGDKIQDIEELKNLLLFDTGVEGVDKVYLSDVADIKNIDNSDNIYAKVNGNDAAVLTFQKQSNYSTAEVSNSIREKIDEITKDNKDISITPLMDQGIYIDIVVDSVLKNLLYGGILAILILILFLRDIRPTFIIALSIPISIIFAIAMMYFTGVTINIISLAGLALGVGMLVDNSIVVIENIYRLRNKGVSATKASIEGAREISGALLASTLTTAVVFLPIVFTKGISRQLFTDMGLTIAYSLFASLLVALTLVPTLASSILKDTKEKSHNLFDRFVNRYEIILRWSLKHKGLVIIGVIALLVVSGFLGIRMGTSFIPEMESPQMSITIELPKESTSEDIKLMTDTVVDRIIDIDGIETLGAFRAESMGGMGDNGNNNSMSIYVILDENKVSSNTEIGKQIKKLTEDLDCTINVNTSTMDMSALAGTGIEAIVKGREVDKLREISGDVAKILEETEGTAEVSDGLDENVMEIRVVVDKEKAMEEGLTVAQVFSNINTLVSKGKSSTTLTVNNKDYPVIVVDGENQNMTRSDLENLTIELDKDGEETSVKLMDIAEVSQEHGLSSIKRDSQERYISITANIDDDYNIGLVSREFEKKLKDYKVPDGYKIEISGETEMINESLKDLFYMLILAIAFIYLIMVAQFQSLLSPFIVMFTIPLAFTGGFLALAITGYDLSIISMLGFLVLSGVVVNNGIVFVDYTNQLRESGMEKTESLILAGKTRMRPILMTAITTILGLSTLSFGVGMGAEMLQPLAIASIGGLTYATILTLIFVPVMYDILHRNKLGKTSDKGDE